MNNAEMDIRIVSVAEVPRLTRFHRWEMLRYGNFPTDIEVGLTARIDEDGQPDRLCLRLTSLYTYMRTMVRRPLLECTVDCVFEIPHLSDHVAFDSSRRQVDLPPSVLTLMLSVGIGVMRGMLARRCEDTPLAERPLPLINISALVSKLMYHHIPASAPVPLEEPVCG